MSYIEYVPRKFSAASLDIIDSANEKIAEYEEMGFSLTLRQLYYRFVSDGEIENTLQSYKRFGSILNDARLAGKISWDAIEDRTRNLQTNSHWRDMYHILGAVESSFMVDRWTAQPVIPEVWVEKEALINVVSGVCARLDVPFFACRGYVSQSEEWAAGQRILNRFNRHSQKTVIIYLGDHDPSGIDMRRDHEDRLSMFITQGLENTLHDTYEAFDIERVALNMDQIEEYAPPPNPAKVTDSRFNAYRDEFGDESWELDALHPNVIVDLIEETVLSYRDDTIYQSVYDNEQSQRKLLKKIIEGLK